MSVSLEIVALRSASLLNMILPLGVTFESCGKYRDSPCGLVRVTCKAEPWVTAAPSEQFLNNELTHRALHLAEIKELLTGIRNIKVTLS